MHPKQRTKTSKTNTTRPTPGGVKKRGESTAYKPRKKIPEPPLSWHPRPLVTPYDQVRDTTLAIRQLVRSFKKLEDFLREHKLYYIDIPEQTRRLTIQRKSKELKRLLDAVCFAIDTVDAKSISPPVLAFHNVSRGKKAYKPLTMGEVKEYVNILENINRHEYEYLKTVGKNWSLQERLAPGFEEEFVVPFSAFQLLSKLGYPETLTPLQRELFMIYFKWIKSHTQPIIKRYMEGTTYNKANLAKIRGETYTPNFFSAATSSAASVRKRTR